MISWLSRATLIDVLAKSIKIAREIGHAGANLYKMKILFERSRREHFNGHSFGFSFHVTKMRANEQKLLL